MPIVESKPPAAVVQAFRRGLEEMVQIDRAPAGLVDYKAHRVYVLTLEEAKRRTDLKNLPQVAWRFLTGEHHPTPVAITIPTPARGRRPQMASMETGNRIRQSFLRVVALNDRPSVLERDYELRRLRVPGTTGVFWLASQDGSDTDLFIPFVSTDGLKNDSAYPRKQFLARLKAVAEKKRASPIMTKPPRTSKTKKS